MHKVLIKDVYIDITHHVKDSKTYYS